MPKRIEAIHRWLTRELGYRDYALRPASSDASFRRYFRLVLPDSSLIVMDAPPDRQDTASYLEVGRRLRTAGLNVPDILAREPAQGFLLITDLGEVNYLDRLDADNRDRLYGDALDSLLRMQAEVAPSGLPDYDRKLLGVELSLFSDWFLNRHLGITLEAAQGEILKGLNEILVQNALEQPRLFVHRDYHSRNLMVRPENNPGILDFQDAVHGPITYDLVSLLRDCYIAWPRLILEGWVEDYHHGLSHDTPLEQFFRWFDLMGIQRHLKAVGIFARLSHRDGKPGYLQDIPRTLNYVLEVSLRYRELSPLPRLLDELGIRERLTADDTRT